MRLIEVRPMKRFKGPWTAFEAPGVEPSFGTRQEAIDYARQRFGGGAGKIHIYDDAGEKIEQTVTIDSRGKYGFT